MTSKDRKNLEEELKSLRPEDIFRPLDDVVANAPPLYPLWGYFFFRKCVTSLVGDPGISKTTLGYSMFHSLSNGEPFLGIKPEEPINVLYMDFESSDSLVASRHQLVINDKSPNFILYNIVDYYLPQIATLLVQYCKDYDINMIVIDNQSMAFNTRDENDNSEAKREMKFIRSIAIACNAGVLIYHHPSKSNMPGTRKGSGAFARARLADVMINLDYAVEGNEDVIMLQTVKNRMTDEKVVWYINKTGGKFVFCDMPTDIDIPKQATNTYIYQAQEKILEMLKNGNQYKAVDIIREISNKEITEYIIVNALNKLRQHRRVSQPKYGYYGKV